ncbi:Uncharacterized protein K02A2.6 [Stylophora pistillata]|uniref:Uncharacterized protein K02A2.6 n=1 Tax=Stylophora pistillata TaxID=50429 RepID=A0A2B4SCS8_STYPI|nr:Uncharacterized protein K02A2.6 [Stylophora pistillata]
MESVVEASRKTGPYGLMLQRAKTKSKQRSGQRWSSETNVSVSYVEFLVISKKGRPILGRKTVMQLGVLAIKVPESEVNLVESEFQELFSDKVGKLTNYSVELHLKPDARFVAQPCRRVPYSLRSKVEENLTELEDMDIIERVEAPELYQYVIDQVLHSAGCTGCQSISDDIVVYGKDVAELDERLKKVIHTLKETGLTLNKKKCVFRMNEIEFMANLLLAKGIGPTESRGKALQEASEPKDSLEVRSFLGWVNFSARFISGLVTRAEPLRRLTKKNTPFVRGKNQRKAFEALKNSLTDVDALACFNPALKTRVVADASPVGLANELCVVGGIVMRGTSIVIPKGLRTTVLTIGHEGHLGVVSMKQRIRIKVWWPKLEKDVERFVKTCDACQLVGRPDPPDPVASTELPQGPWCAVAIDYLGPLPSGEHIVVVVDYYSRYYEVAVVRTITSEKTIELLETIFDRHGLPELLVSDNGPKHRRVTTRWAQANGEVERQNRSILKRLQLAHAEGKDWRRELARYMAVYRTTPPQTTGQIPAFLLMGRHPRTKLLELSQPTHGDEETRDGDQLMKFKRKQYSYASRNAKMSEVKQGDLVLMKQDKKNKLSTTFEPQLYKVKEKKGNQVVVSDSDNLVRVWHRNRTKVKQ